MKWKKWRIAEPHPEDRYEPEDEVADDLRRRLCEIEDRVQAGDMSAKLAVEQRKLRLELAERLYGA